jgi:drug/metabolite transporter (DMT)-like permease
MSGNKAALNERKLGVSLVVFSALVFSTAGVFTKGVLADAWTVIFWRGVFAAAFTIAYVIWRRKLRTEFAQMGRSGWAVAIIGASATTAFLSAFKLTSIGNVALIWAASPMFAALITYYWINERLTRIQAIACAVAFGGVLIIVYGSLGSFNLKGDLLALWMTVGMAILMAIYRRWPDTPAAGPAAMSSIILLPFGLFLADVMAVSQRDFMLLIAFGLVFALASVTLGEGVKRISAGETALLGMLEVPIAPILAYLIFTEIPPAATFFGGALIFASVAASQISTKEK